MHTWWEHKYENRGEFYLIYQRCRHSWRRGLRLCVDDISFDPVKPICMWTHNYNFLKSGSKPFRRLSSWLHGRFVWRVKFNVTIFLSERAIPKNEQPYRIRNLMFYPFRPKRSHMVFTVLQYPANHWTFLPMKLESRMTRKRGLIW